MSTATDTLELFFSADAAEVQRALVALAADPQTLARAVRQPSLPPTVDGRDSPCGPFSSKLFGPPGSPERAQGWGVVPLPAPLVHPALHEAVAARLGWTLAELRAVIAARAWIDGGRPRVPPGHPGCASGLTLRLSGFPGEPRGCASADTWESYKRIHEIDPAITLEDRFASYYAERGIDAAALGSDDWRTAAEAATGATAVTSELTARLRGQPGGATGWVVSAIPVPPPARRPLAPDGIGVRPGPINSALLELLGVATRWCKLVELGAPAEVCAEAMLLTQEVFDLYWARVAGQPPLAPLTPEEPRELSWLMDPKHQFELHATPWSTESLGQIRALAFVGDDAIAASFVTTTMLFDRKDGTILDRWPAPFLRVSGFVDPEGRRIHFENDFVFDRRERRWLKGSMPERPRLGFHESLGDGLVFDTPSQRRVRLPGKMEGGRLTPCGDHVLLREREGDCFLVRFDGELDLVIADREVPRLVGRCAAEVHRLGLAGALTVMSGAEAAALSIVLRDIEVEWMHPDEERDGVDESLNPQPDAAVRDPETGALRLSDRRGRRATDPPGLRRPAAAPAGNRRRARTDRTRTPARSTAAGSSWR